MLGSAILELLAGLATIYLIFSVIASALAEAWESLPRGLKGGLRGSTLAKAIDRILPRDSSKSGSTGKPAPNSSALLSHRLVDALAESAPAKKRRRQPSYLPAPVFSKALLDILVGKVGRSSAEQVQALNEKLVPGETLTSATGDSTPLVLDGATVGVLRNMLQSATERTPTNADGILQGFSRRIEEWYNHAQDRAVGWYKRALQKRLVLIAIALVMVSNLDLFQTTQTLYQDAQLRQVVSSLDVAPDAEAAALFQQLQNSQLPIGLPQFADLGLKGTLLKIFGLLASVFAVSLGAPFWFDLLNKLVTLRGSGKTASKEASVDSANATPTTPAESGATTVTTLTPVTAAQGLLPTLPTDYWTLKLKGPESVKPHRNNIGSYGNAAIMARMSSLAYMSLPVVEEMLASVGTPITTFNSGGTQAFAYVAGNNGPRVISFRGTEPKELQDIIADAKFALRERPFSESRTYNVHLGFYEALEEVWSDVMNWVMDNGGKDQEIWLTGHSLGAALATVAAARLEAQAVPSDKLRLFTFGSPRVGDADFAARFQANGKEDGIASYRFINNEDLVTRVPPRKLGYKHAGRIRYFRSDGTVSEHLNEWVRFLGTFLNAVDDFKKAAGSTVGDHSMDFYVQRVDQYESQMPKRDSQESQQERGDSVVA